MWLSCDFYIAVLFQDVACLEAMWQITKWRSHWLSHCLSMLTQHNQEINQILLVGAREGVGPRLPPGLRVSLSSGFSQTTNWSFSSSVWLQPLLFAAQKPALITKTNTQSLRQPFLHLDAALIWVLRYRIPMYMFNTVFQSNDMKKPLWWMNVYPWNNESPKHMDKPRDPLFCTHWVCQIWKGNHCLSQCVFF